MNIINSNYVIINSIMIVIISFIVVIFDEMFALFAGKAYLFDNTDTPSARVDGVFWGIIFPPAGEFSLMGLAD